MDIPLPGEPDPQLAKHSTELESVDISSPHNIPLPSPRTVQLPPRSKVEESKNLCSSPPPLPPGSVDGEDSNRYSPSRVTGDDDTGKDDQPDQESTPRHGSPLVPTSLGSKGTRTTVLGKVQAKKRLLAFSMTKQGGGQGLSFGFNRKAPKKMSTGTMPFAGSANDDDAGVKDKDERLTSPKKKGMGKKGISRDDKARAVVSAIEEIKREEMLMRGVLGYNSQIGPQILGDQTYPLPLMSASILPPVKPRDELEMSNILSEQRKGAIEELLGSLLTHDSEKKSKDEEKERKRSEEKKKRDSEKSSHHSKEHHRSSKERHSRSGREREKEEKKHRPSELPKNWQQFRDRGFKFEEIRRLKLKLEKDKLASNNRGRTRKSRDREHRSRSREKRHKSPTQSEDKDRTPESDHDIMLKPFESTSRVIYPFLAVGVRQMQKEYPRSLIHFTKFRPSIPYCENPASSKAYYRTRKEILCEASQRVVDLMHCVINGDLCKINSKTEKNYKAKQTTDANLSNSLAALQVSYDETEIDENMSSSDDTSGTRRERPWFLPEKLVVWPDGEEACPSTGSDVEMNVKRERSDETDVDSYSKKKDSSVESSEVRENELPNYLNSERERDVKSSEPETKGSLRSGERTTVRSKWDSDYEDDRVQDDIITQNSQSPETVNDNAEKWEEKDQENNFAEISVKDEISVENQDKSGSESDNSSDSSSESSSANESNSEDSTTVAKDSLVLKDKETENLQNPKTGKEIDEENTPKSVKCAYATGLPQESSTNNAHPENSGDGNTNLKLASEYEEFMKAVSFESSAVEDGDMEIPSSEVVVKGALKRVGTPDTPAQERRDRRNSADSEASHDKLDIEPARVEETQHLKKLSETKLHNKPKLMTSSASEDELMPPEKEEKQESKVRALDNVEQNNTHPKKDRKQRSSSSDSSSSSESSAESEEVKEKRKSKSKKTLKKKRKKVVHNKKKQRKTSKKKRANSSSSSESDSSSNADSSSSSSDDHRKKPKHKERSRRRAKSSSSEGSDSSSENVSSDDRSARKKKKKKKAKRIPKKKPSKKRKRSRKESESSDSEDNVRSRRSKSTRHKTSKKDISKENNIEQNSSDEKATVHEDLNSTSHRKDSDVRSDHSKKASGKNKGSNETETSHKKSSKKYSKDSSSIDENYNEEREKKSGSKKKSSSSYKKSSHHHASESSDDESERKSIKKRRRERRSCTTSPVVSSNKKRRRSPSTSPEHSPTPQRRNSTEGKTVSQRERSKEQSSSSRKLKHSSGSKKGHKQKDLEGSENSDDFSEECSFKRNEDLRFRNSNVLERNDWEDNSSNDSCDNRNSREENKSDDAKDTNHRTSPRKAGFEDNYPVQLLRSEDIKKEVFSEEDEDNFTGKDSMEGNIDKNTQRFVSDDETEDDHGYQKQSRSSISGKSDSSCLKSFGDKYSFVKVKVEPEDVTSDTEKNLHNPKVPLLYSPDPPEDETPKSHLSNSQSREICSTDSSQFSHMPDKIIDRFGSDLSRESFKDSQDANFSGKLFQKQNYNLSEESFRPGSRNPETPRVVSNRGTNFTLDNIPLTPILANRDDTVSVTQLEDISMSTQNKQINTSISEKLPNLPVPELNSSSSKSVKTPNERQAISFKLLSPSGRLQSSQSLVDSSDNVDDDNSNMSAKQHVTQELKNEKTNLDKRIESDSEKRSGASVFESSRDQWFTNLQTVEQTPASSITTETTVSEVTSSSKIPVLTEAGSSNSDSHPKERQRKRPSRWGMTTVPPKKKVIEELYESLPLARNESDALSESVSEKIFYDQYIPSNIEKKENLPTKNVQGICFMDSAVKKSSDVFNEISEKKELINRSKSRNFSEWEIPEGVEEGWEASREKDASLKNRYIHDQWHDRPARREKFTSEKVEKDNSEGCGPLIDWENDLEQPKGINVLPTTEAVNLFHYSHEPEMPKNSSQARSHLEKENICQDESESEWESREVTYHSKSSAFRMCDVKPDAKEKIVTERQESVEKSSQRHIDFVDDKSWDERKWQNQDTNASKRDDKRHRDDELHDIRRAEHDIRKDMRDTRTLNEGSGGVYKDMRGIDESDAVANNKEKERTEESQTSHDDYQFRKKFTEDGSEESDPNKLLVHTPSLINHGEDRKVNVLISGEHTKGDKSDDQYRKDEKEKVSRERRVVEGQDAEDVHDKNKKEYTERIKREIEDREQRDEDRIRKPCGERERVDEDQRREDRSRKDYCDGERIGFRDKERRENDIRDSRHDEEPVRKDFAERERSSARERERRDSRDRREERRRERERDRRSDRRDRGRWEREKRDRHREDRESNQRNRSPTDYHHDRDRRESHREGREHSHSPPPDYWQGEWEREPKERDCDCTGNYYLRDIPLPVNSTLGGASTWPSGAAGEADMELSRSPASSPLVGFKRSLADSTISDSELVSSKQEDMAHRSQEMSPSSTAYPPGLAPSKSYERKPPYLKQQVVASSPSDRPPTPTDSPAFSPKRLSLDDRIEMELGVKNTPPPLSAAQYQVYQHQQPPPCPQPQQAPHQQVPTKQPPQQQQQQQQSAFPYAQYYAHVPPPPYGQPVEEYAPPQHMYPPPPVKPGVLQMPPPSLDAPPQKRRRPLLPTPNIRPLTNWDSPEAFIGVQPSQSSRVVQVGNVLQVVPVEVPPPAVPGPQSSSQSMVLQTGNVLQVIPSDALPNTVPPVSCSEPPPVSNSSSQVVQVGNVLQVIPGTSDISTRQVTMPIATPPKSTFPPTSTHLAAQGLSPHMPPLHLPPMHGPPPGPAPALLPTIPSHPPPTHCPPPHTPPMRGPPIHTPPIQVPSVHGLLGHAPSPSQGVPLLTSPSLEMSPSPAITSPLVSVHGPVPPPVSGVQVTTSVATSPIPSIPASGAPVISSASSAISAMPTNVVPTPVAAPISYSPPASPFLVPPVVHAPMVSVALTEGTPAVGSQDCPIPFLSSVEMAQASQMEEAERRRADRARRRAEKEKRRKEKEKRHQNKIKQATEMIIKKAFEQDGEMLSTASDIDLEEMRLIEEAMQQVPEPEEEEEMPQTDAEQQLRKRKRKNPVDIQILPPAGKGILVSPGFREKPLGGGGIERKSVKFADGVRPGEGTSPSAGEDLPSPPPPPRKLPKEKRYKKKKKKKIKVKIIRQINVEDEDDDDEDISPPPPPPGSPPPPPMYPPGAHYPPTYPSGFTYSTAPPFTVLPGVDSSAATGTSGNLFTPLYHQHHHTTTTTHTTTVQFAPPPPVTPVPPPPPNPHMFKRESKSNP
ncbi:hypothetical protein R5R35_007975 [Gryllus longicercus]|uniref:Uncharacterized protein n=1 Tax=Gryllus longicercus TaxID=2509291 RepID=A0AAN9VIJ0_9ORTH